MLLWLIKSLFVQGIVYLVFALDFDLGYKWLLCIVGLLLYLVANTKTSLARFESIYRTAPGFRLKVLQQEIVSASSLYLTWSVLLVSFYRELFQFVMCSLICIAVLHIQVIWCAKQAESYAKDSNGLP